MITIETIITQQVHLFNETSTFFEEFKERDVNEAYLTAYVIDENQHQLLVIIPFNGLEPYTKLI